MTEATWIAVMGLMASISTGIATGLVQVVKLLLAQSQDTIRTLQADRDYWRDRALGTDGDGTEAPP